MSRTTLARTYRMAQTAAGSRATAREFDDDHLMQEIKQADVFHSETPSNFERFQPVGLTAVPLKQQQNQQIQSTQTNKTKSEGEGDWNHNQPKGPAAEVFMGYANGSRSHPVALMTDDRRVRPYAMKEGRGATYAPDGSEQMLYFKQDGAYLVSLDGKSVEKPDGNDTRMASMRHVNKDMQTHKIEQGGQQQQEEYKHEGKTVNTEIRCIKDKILFYAPGDKNVGYYDKSAKKWFFDVDAAGVVTLEMTDSKITAKVGDSTIVMESGKIKLKSAQIVTEGETHLGGEGGKKVVRDADPEINEASTLLVYAL